MWYNIYIRYRKEMILMTNIDILLHFFEVKGIDVHTIVWPEGEEVIVDCPGADVDFTFELNGKLKSASSRS